MEKLIEQMTEIFEIETVNDNDVLRSYELWDSLSVISLLAVLDTDFGVTIESEDLAEIVTVRDLFLLVQARRTR